MCLIPLSGSEKLSCFYYVIVIIFAFCCVIFCLVCLLFASAYDTRGNMYKLLPIYCKYELKNHYFTNRLIVLYLLNVKNLPVYNTV